MDSPRHLPEEALAILRWFVQAGSRQAGSPLPYRSIREVWRHSESGLEAGLAALAAAGLVETNDSEPEPRAILTRKGEELFARFYRSCY